MRNSIVLALVTMIILSCGAQSGTTTKTELDLTKEMDRLSYSMGVLMGQNLKKEGMDEIDADIIAAAIRDVLSGGDLKIDETTAITEYQNYRQALQAKQFEGNIKAGQEFLAANKEKEGVVELESGLQYKVITEGSGPKPGPNDKVRTHYHGTLIDGTVFDSSVDRGEPISFNVGGVIKGWTEALQLMPVGSKWMLYIPSELAYGANPRPGGPIGPHETLIFEVELLGIE